MNNYKVFEKVNPSHPDKIADRIAGAIVDKAYASSLDRSPRIAVEVLLGHHACSIILESSVKFDTECIHSIVERINGEKMDLKIVQSPQDEHLAENQSDGVRCGDNGIFKGTPVTTEQGKLADVARYIYYKFPTDGKYIIRNDSCGSQPDYKMTICQSHMKDTETFELIQTLRHGFGISECLINPLGEWTGGTNVDSGATNRKLGSDMGDGVTGGGLHGKDLSKSDVSVNIICFIKAQELGEPVYAYCSIGDSNVKLYTKNYMLHAMKYSDIVEQAGEYIKSIGGFEEFAEWGMIR